MYRSIGSRDSSKTYNLFSRMELLLDKRDDAIAIFVCSNPAIKEEMYIRQKRKHSDRIKWYSYAEYIKFGRTYRDINTRIKEQTNCVFIDELDFYLKAQDVYGYSITWDNTNNLDILDDSTYAEGRQL